MERYFGSGVQAVRKTMLRQEELFREQVSELHRLYNVQKLLMEEMTMKSCETPSLIQSSTQPCFSQQQSGCILNLRGDSSAICAPINNLNDNSTRFSKTQPLFPLSPKTPKSEYDAAFSQELFDSRKATGFSHCRKKLDLERPPDEDLDEDFDGIASKQQESRMADNSCFISNMKGSKNDEPKDVSLCLNSGWESLVTDQETRQTRNSVSNLSGEAKSNDIFKSVKWHQSAEDGITFSLFPTTVSSNHLSSKAHQESSKNAGWEFDLEKIPDTAMSQLQDETRNEEPQKQERKFFEIEADLQSSHKVVQQSHRLSQGCIFGSREWEHNSRLMSQVTSLLPRKCEVNSDIPKFRNLHIEAMVAAAKFSGKKNGNPNATTFLCGSPTNVVVDSLLPAVDMSIMSLSPGAALPSIYADAGSARSSQKISELSLDRGHMKSWMSTAGLRKYDSYKHDHRAPGGVQSRNSQENLCSGGHGIPFIDTNLSVGKSPVQEPALGLWPELKKLSGFQTSQWQAQQAIVAGQSNIFSKEHASWQASRHPVSSHASGEVGTISAAPSTISSAEPFGEVYSKNPDNFLRPLSNRESFCPQLTFFPATPNLRQTSVKGPYDHLFQHTLGKEQSSISSEKVPSFPDLLLTNTTMEDSNKHMDLQIGRTQRLEGTLNCVSQPPKINMEGSLGDAKELSIPKALNNHQEGEASISDFRTGWDAKDASQVCQTFHHLKDSKKTVPLQVDSRSLVSLDADAAHRQVKDVKLALARSFDESLRQSSFQDTIIFPFLSKDEAHKLLLPSVSPSSTFPDEKQLLRGLKDFNRGFDHTFVDGQEKSLQPAESALPTQSSHDLEVRCEKPNISTQANEALPQFEGSLKFSTEPKQSSFAVSSLNGHEGDAESSGDDGIESAAFTLLSFQPKMSSASGEAKVSGELTPPLLKQSVAWFANAILGDEDFQNYRRQCTSNSNTYTGTSLSSPECDMLSTKLTSTRSLSSDKLWNGSSNKEFLRYLSRTLNANINKAYTSEKEMDLYESMILALKPSIITLDSVCRYLPETFESTSDLHGGKDTRSRASKRGKRKKDFQSEILPGMSSLSRQEIKEDIQTLSKLAKFIMENGRQNSILPKANISSTHEGEAYVTAARRRAAKICNVTNINGMECAASSDMVLQHSDFKKKSAPTNKVDGADTPYPLRTWRDVTRRRRMQRSRRYTFADNH